MEILLEVQRLRDVKSLSSVFLVCGLQPAKLARRRLVVVIVIGFAALPQLGLLGSASVEHVMGH